MWLGTQRRGVPVLQFLFGLWLMTGRIRARVLLGHVGDCMATTRGTDPCVLQTPYINPKPCRHVAWDPMTMYVRHSRTCGTSVSTWLLWCLCSACWQVGSLVPQVHQRFQMELTCTPMHAFIHPHIPIHAICGWGVRCALTSNSCWHARLKLRHHGISGHVGHVC